MRTLDYDVSVHIQPDIKPEVLVLSVLLPQTQKILIDGFFTYQIFMAPVCQKLEIKFVSVHTQATHTIELPQCST